MIRHVAVATPPVCVVEATDAALRVHHRTDWSALRFCALLLGTVSVIVGGTVFTYQFTTALYILVGAVVAVSAFCFADIVRVAIASEEKVEVTETLISVTHRVGGRAMFHRRLVFGPDARVELGKPRPTLRPFYLPEGGTPPPRPFTHQGVVVRSQGNHLYVGRYVEDAEVLRQIMEWLELKLGACAGAKRGD